MTSVNMKICKKCASYQCACAHNAQRGWKTRSGIPSKMTDTTFYSRTLPSFSFAERTCVAIFFLKMAKWPCYMSALIQVKIHELPSKKVKQI